MTDNAKALVDHIRSDLTYITGLADHMEAGGDVSKKNIGDLIAMVRWNAEHHLECRDTIEIQGREIERLSAVIEKYATSLCEMGIHHECCGWLSEVECGGCFARAALAGENNG